MSTLELLSLLVAIAALFGWVSMRWLRLPITIGTMVLTVIAAVALEAASAWTPGMHLWAARLVTQIDFPRLILHGMLAMLLFAGAFLLDLEHLAEQRMVVAVLAVAGTLLTAAAVAALMFGVLRMMGMPAAWLPCLLFGALISPTDPIAVLEMLRRVGVSAGLQAQLAGESLFNDGLGAVLFLMLLEVARGAGSPAPGHLAWMLLLQVGGALALGIGAAWVTSWLMDAILGYQVEILLTLALALGGYALAERWHLSAPLEAVIAGLALRWFNQRQPQHRIAHESIDRFWEVIDKLQNAVLFVLLGLEVLAIPFGRAAEPGAAAIAIVLGVRFAVVAVLLFALRVFGRRFNSSVAVLGWGGLHGGLSLALALSLPVLAKGAWVLPATYMVVLFSIVVQGGSMPLLLKRFASAGPEAVDAV